MQLIQQRYAVSKHIYKNTRFCAFTSKHMGFELLKTQFHVYVDTWVCILHPRITETIRTLCFAVEMYATSPTRAPVPEKQAWRIWVNELYE